LAIPVNQTAKRGPLHVPAVLAADLEKSPGHLSEGTVPEAVRRFADIQGRHARSPRFRLGHGYAV
jgi:hypothetical protein